MENIFAESKVLQSFIDDLTPDYLYQNQVLLNDIIEHKIIWDKIFKNQYTELTRNEMIIAIQYLHKFHVVEYYDVIIDVYINMLLELERAVVISN